MKRRAKDATHLTNQWTRGETATFIRTSSVKLYVVAGGFARVISAVEHKMLRLGFTSST